MIKSTLTILLCSFLIFIGCEPASQGDKQAFNEALRNFRARQYDSCETKLQAYTSKFPKDDQGWCFLGTVALKLDHDSLAAISYTRCLDLNPKEYKALTGLGVLERKKHNDKKAADYYHQAISVNPAYAKAYSSLLIIELRDSNHTEAIRLGEKAVSLDTSDLGIKANLAIAYHFANRYEDRDAVIEELKQKRYPYLEELDQLLTGVTTLDDL